MEREGLREMRDHGWTSEEENRITIALGLLPDLSEGVWGLKSQDLWLSAKLLDWWGLWGGCFIEMSLGLKKRDPHRSLSFSNGQER